MPGLALDFISGNIPPTTLVGCFDNITAESNDIAVGGVIAGDTTDVIIEKVTAKNISSLELTRQLLDAQVRKRGEQTGLDTLVVHAVNDEC